MFFDAADSAADVAAATAAAACSGQRPGLANIFCMEAIRGEIFSFGSLKKVSLATFIS